MKPIIGITIGDVAGIGPEITTKTLTLKKVYRICRPVVIGDAKVMAKTLIFAKVPLKMNKILKLSDAKFEYGIIDVLDLDNVDVEDVVMGAVNAPAGKAAIDYIVKAVNLALKGLIDAITTCPVNKVAVNKAGYHFTGHTEFLAQLTGAKEYGMMFVAGTLRVIHVTTHMSLREACNRVTKEKVLTTIKLAHQAIQDLGLTQSRIVVAALNPHGGEGGLFGREEIDEIIPAVESAKRLGLEVSGPIPADTVFAKARDGAFDIVVVMYHDQGHIPTKLTALRWSEERGRWTALGGVNTTIGLPIIRTSVDHGTAYEVAGKGIANPQSLVEAIELAAKMANQKYHK